jgi:tetratricopeptide (TPR) repeat protein
MLTEGRRWLESALANQDDVPTPLVVKTLEVAGNFAHWQGDYARAPALHEQGVTLGTQIDDRRLLIGILESLGMSLWLNGEPDEAIARMEQSLTLAREYGDLAAISRCLRDFGLVARSQQRYDQAQALFTESVVYARQAGNNYHLARGLCHLGRTAFLQGDYAQAETLLRGSLTVSIQLGMETGLHAGDPLEGLAALAGVQGKPERAARLFGAGAQRRVESGNLRYAPHQRDYERDVAMVRDQLDPATFAAAWAGGQAMTVEQAIAYALETPDAPEAQLSPPNAHAQPVAHQ